MCMGAGRDVAHHRRTMRELSLFTGAGLGLLGTSRLLGWRTVAACELDPYCRSVLLQRQRDGLLDRFPIWEDILTLDARPFRGAVDVVTGGFPCQDISSAGKRRGLSGERSGLVFDMLRVVDECRPRFVFAENSPMLRTNGLGTILERLAVMGYDCRWCVLGASDVGAPHRRKRMWLLAKSHDERDGDGAEHAEVASASTAGDASNADGCVVRKQPGRAESWPTAKELGGARWWGFDLDSGVDARCTHRMDRVRATGNGQVPAVVRLAWQLLSDGWLRPTSP